MPDFIKEPDFWLSVITAFAAIIALFQSHAQVKISNKQELFERRVEKYLIIDELISLFKNTKQKLEKLQTDETYDDVKSIFISMTNATLLKRMRIDFFNPFEENDSDDFFEVSEALHTLSVEVGLIWKEKDSKVISNFITDYSSLLSALYIQNAYIISEIQSPTIPENTLKNKAKQMADQIQLEEKIKKTTNSYDELIKCKSIEKIRKQIRL